MFINSYDNGEIKFKNYIKNDYIVKDKDNNTLTVDYKSSIDKEIDPGYLLPYDPATFDKIYCIETYEREWEFPQRISEVYGKVKPGGQIYVKFSPADHKKFTLNVSSTDPKKLILAYNGVTFSDVLQRITVDSKDDHVEIIINVQPKSESSDNSEWKTWQHHN